MDWKTFIKSEKQKDYCKRLMSFVNSEYANYACFPPKNQIYNAFSLTPFDSVKVVILGQDPYHNAGQAVGLAFSVDKKTTIPRSLRNIYKEISDEYGYPTPNTGDLSSWAKQGVLLLNSILTVRAGSPASHANKGWETFTDNILLALNQKDTPIVFMMWGNYAINKSSIITNPKHLVLTSAHPSPYSAKNFFGNGHFKTCNEFLIKNNMAPIDWRIR